MYLGVQQQQVFNETMQEGSVNVTKNSKIGEDNIFRLLRQTTHVNNGKDLETTESALENGLTTTVQALVGNQNKTSLPLQSIDGKQNMVKAIRRALYSASEGAHQITQLSDGSKGKSEVPFRVSTVTSSYDALTTDIINESRGKVAITAQNNDNGDNVALTELAPTYNNGEDIRTKQRSDNEIHFISRMGIKAASPPEATTTIATKANLGEISADSITPTLHDLKTNRRSFIGQSRDLIQPPTYITFTTLAMVIGGQAAPLVVSATTTEKDDSAAIAGNREGWEIPVLISLAILVLLLLVLLAVFCLVCKHRVIRARTMRNGSSQDLKHAETGSAKNRLAQQPSDTWPVFSQDSNPHVQMASGFSDQYFESDFSNTLPWAFENILCQEMSEDEVATLKVSGRQDNVEMSTFSTPKVDNKNEDVHDLHPDYYFENLKKQLEEEEKCKMTNSTARDSETDTHVNSDPHSTDSVDKRTDVYSVVAPKKPKRKTTIIGSNAKRSAHLSISNHSSGVPKTDIKKSQSEYNMRTHNEHQLSYDNYFEGNDHEIGKIGRYQTHVHLEEIDKEDYLNHVESKIYTSTKGRGVKEKFGIKFSGGFETSDKHVFDRNRRLDKCVSFDEAERQHLGGTASGISSASEVLPFRYRTGNVDLCNSPDLRINRDLSKDNAKDTKTSSNDKPELVLLTSPCDLEMPKSYSFSAVEQGTLTKDSLSGQSASSSSFLFMRKTTDRILANREILKRRHSPNSSMFDESELNRCTTQQSGKMYQDQSNKSLKTYSISESSTNQSQRFDEFRVPNKDKKDAVFFRAQTVPKITINNQNDSDDSSSNGKDTESVRIYFNALKFSQKRDSDPSTTVVSPNSDCNDETFVEKLRRFSAPTMNDSSPQLPNISPAFQRRIFKSMSSDGLGRNDINWESKYYRTLPQNQRSWSDDFYDLIRRTDSSDPEKAEYFKKLINDRYEALFSNKYSDFRLEGFKSNVDGVCRRLGASDHPSPRIVKRRSAATRQKRLSRESSPIHSPFNSIDDGVSSQPTSPLFGAHNDIGHVKLPDPSQWKFLYDKVSSSRKPTAFDRDREKLKPPRRGLAEGTDGAENNKNATKLEPFQHGLDSQNSQQDSGATFSSTHRSNMGSNVDQLVRNYESAPNDTHIYSEIRGAKFDKNKQKSSNANTIDRGDNGKMKSKSPAEPIYESILSVSHKIPNTNDSVPFSVITKPDNNAMEEGRNSDGATNDYAEIGDLPNRHLEEKSRTHRINIKNGKSPQLPPFRPNQLSCALKNIPLSTEKPVDPFAQQIISSEIEYANPRQLRPRSLTTSDTSRYEAFPALVSPVTSSQHKKLNALKIGRRSRNPNSPRNQKPLKKARRFSKDSDAFQKLTNQCNGSDVSQSKEPVIGRARAYSVPTLSAGDMVIDLDLTQFKSSASNLILEHSDTNESMLYDENTVSTELRDFVKEGTPNGREKAQVQNGHSANSRHRNTGKVNYFGLNKAVLANLQKSSV